MIKIHQAQYAPSYPTFSTSTWNFQFTLDYEDHQGHPSPKGNDAFASCFRFPPLFQNICQIAEKFSMLTIFDKNFYLYLLKFLMTSF